MLLQSWRGVVRIFPAVPEDWKTASFEKLRAEGALTVSAERENGQTKRVSIRAGKKITVRLVDPFEGQGRWNRRLRMNKGLLVVALAAGEVLEGKR